MNVKKAELVQLDWPQVLKQLLTWHRMRLLVGHGGPVWQEEISCCAYYLEQLFKDELTYAQTRMYVCKYLNMTRIDIICT